MTPTPTPDDLIRINEGGNATTAVAWIVVVAVVFLLVWITRRD